MSAQAFLCVSKSQSQPLPNQETRLHIQDAGSFNFGSLINKTPFNRRRSTSPQKPCCRIDFNKLPEKNGFGIAEKSSSSQPTTEDDSPKINKFGTFPLGILKNGRSNSPVKISRGSNSLIASKKISFA